MPAPLKPTTISEQAAEPTAVDYPLEQGVIALPADETTAENVRDTGFVFDEFYPGDSQGMPDQKRPVLQANRVTVVSDSIVFGSSLVGPNAVPGILIPAHRDRVRVTIQAVVVGGDPVVYLGNGPDIAAGGGWALATSDPVYFDTRDAIWFTSGAGANPTRVQWAIELVSEGCGCE